MRQTLWFDLFLVAALTTHCQPRDPIQQEQESDPGPSEAGLPAPAVAPDAVQSGENDTMINATEDIADSTEIPVPVAESLSFTHDSSLCAQVETDRSVNLQKCAATSKGQKFMFTRGLDGRYQLRDLDSQLCLGIDPGFFRSLLIAEPCESKASQFFSVIDYDTSYSLRMDTSNSCLDAEDFGTAPGTRIIIFRCTSGPNQKINVLRPKK